MGKQLTFSYDRKRIMLEENDITLGLIGKYVDTYAFVDGRFEVRSKGRSLPYKIFDMDQRVTHAAITDNKCLGAVLEHIKEMQDAAPPKYPVRTNASATTMKRLSHPVPHGGLKLSKTDPRKAYQPCDT